jgi:hypothetical protein
MNRFCITGIWDTAQSMEALASRRSSRMGTFPFLSVHATSAHDRENAQEIGHCDQDNGEHGSHAAQVSRRYETWNAQAAEAGRGTAGLEKPQILS